MTELEVRVPTCTRTHDAPDDCPVSIEIRRRQSCQKRCPPEEARKIHAGRARDHEDPHSARYAESEGNSGSDSPNLTGLT